MTNGKCVPNEELTEELHALTPSELLQIVSNLELSLDQLQEQMTVAKSDATKRFEMIEGCIQWAAQNGYAFAQLAADEYCEPRGLEFVDDQPYYNLSKFQVKS